MARAALFQTRFGRRITLLFVVCALAPVLVIAAIGYFQVRRQLLEHAGLQVTQAAKSVGMGLIDQLQAAHRAFSAGLVDSATFQAAWTVENGAPVIGWGFTPESLARAAHAPGAHRVQLVLLGENPATVWLVRRRGPAAQQWAAVRHDFLFRGASERAVAGSREAAVCVLEPDSGRHVLCPDTDSVAGPRATWDMFLRHDFDAPPWRVTLSVPDGAVLGPISAFRQTFIASLVLVLGLVLLLSSRQVRHSLKPLIELRRGTERVAAGDYTTPVEVTSRDEFEELAGSFNAMTGEVGGLIVRLDQLSYGALQALARTIDASSPWTAGHSERVTAMAVRMARRAGMSKADIDTLRRGALLHDIGKIGIEPRIIDKAGALTIEELERIREHPVLGASILQPLEAFSDALPIVKYHHEKMDGTGYPEGLSGHDIPVMARLVAVSDVYDALVSPRPYRAGWPESVAFDLIRSETGSHFDPEFVRVFFSVISEEGDAARFSRTSAA